MKYGERFWYARSHLRSICPALPVIACWLVSPAQGVEVISTASNATVTIGLPFNSLEFENPLTGTETVAACTVLEWRDADYQPGQPNPYDDWNASSGGIDGNVNEIWMRQKDHSINTTTTVPSTAVSIHLVGDANDGKAEVLVDGVWVATLDMWTASPPAVTALVVVTSLANATHTIVVNDLGKSEQTGQQYDDDVATLGAAALSCPPEVIPTVSAWGAIVMAVLLLAGAKIYFGRGKRAAA